MDQFYESPYRYTEGMQVRYTEYPLASAEQILAYFSDSTLSRLDLNIMQILFRLHYAARRVIESELSSLRVRKPKDLKRTLKHLMETGVVIGFGPVRPGYPDRIRFYMLAEGAVEYLLEHGTQSDLPYTDTLYKERTDIRMVYATMAYHQLASALVPTFGKGRIANHYRQYTIYGIDGNLTADGYMELVYQEQVALLYIHVVRGGRDWLEETKSWYEQLSRYTNGTGNSTVLFLCEDAKQVSELEPYLDSWFPDARPKRYYTYDTLIFSEQVMQRIVACVDNQMQYGTFTMNPS